MDDGEGRGSCLQQHEGEKIMRRVLLLTFIGIMAVSMAALAHHSYAATYDTSKETKLEGKLIQFQFRNPHSYVTIQAPDAKGKMQRWSVEWAGTSQLGRG